MPENTSGARKHTVLELASNLDSVDQAEAAAMESAANVGFDEDSRHDVGMAVRESMVNAVAHGNRYNARKKVRFQVWERADGVVIEIEDEGKGFDMSDVPDPRAEDNVLRHSGRGLLMIRAYMDEFEIGRREPAGTRVRMAKYLRSE
ncbi:MAG: ATP-binding protein [Bryobacteraceae bacterium]